MPTFAAVRCYGAATAAVRLLVGIMISSGVPESHRDSMRQAMATIDQCAVPCHIDTVFFAGAGGDFADEDARHGDIVQLDFKDNIDEGKSFRWFSYAMWLRLTRRTAASHVFKMDVDTSVDWCALCEHVKSLNRWRHAYVGRFNTRFWCGDYDTCPPLRCVDFSDGCWVYAR
jgi:hypothetical protein